MLAIITPILFVLAMFFKNEAVLSNLLVANSIVYLYKLDLIDSAKSAEELRAISNGFNVFLRSYDAILFDPHWPSVARCFKKEHQNDILGRYYDDALAYTFILEGPLKYVRKGDFNHE